ncbi:MFS transporter [Cytophagaceae bacterium DM2B3-1]|uniref:MFS transporter n=2 Tax=Xanthocytophaga TaxID=3078918 RepID=A0ABT7CE15_9BACT|nr:MULTISPECIES: MFS transporter [Xanthocytophaga]MDJ1491968.1 MFS transporter [Xanthocytophaga flavus]MDJ1502641.1 MFS transporter [Xanthocytophaga agilis]
MSVQSPVIEEPRLFTVSFGLLCLSSFLFFASFNMMVPELPDYLTELGGAEYKGLIISLFTLTALLSRPFSGKLTDTVGRVPIMAFGSLVCFICGFLYPIFHTIAGFLLLRLVHGFSTGFKPTATSAYVADIVPLSRLGEAMGLLGMSGTLGSSIGPAIGDWFTITFSRNVMFYSSSGLALMSIAILMGMKETLITRERFQLKHLKISWKDMYEPAVLRPSIVYFLFCFCYGAILTIGPDLSRYLGINNRGLFFTCFTLSSLITRFGAGRISDRHGRESVMKVGVSLMAFSMLLIGLADSPLFLLTGSVVYGIALGICSPTVQAWTIDLAPEDGRGRAVATMYIALEAGIGLGALLSAWLYDNDSSKFGMAFYVMGIITLVGWFYMVKTGKKKLPQ